METLITTSLISPAQVRDIFDISRPTEISWREMGILPRPIAMRRRLYYRRKDIERIINRREQSNGKS